MSLKHQLEHTQKSSKANLPCETVTAMDKASEKLKASGIEENVLKNGEQAPEFNLSNHLGKNRSLKSMLKHGPLVMSFYRGGW